MSYASEREALQGHFKTQWAASAYAAYSVGYDKHSFEFVKDSISVRLSITDGEAQQKSMGDPGNNLVRHVGVLMTQIAVPGGKGSGTVNPIEDVICAMFRNQTIGGVRCRLPYVLSRDEDPPFLISTVVVPFERDEYNG